MNKLLYYPTISIPDPSWLPKALLYWDGLATIAPVEYLEHPSRFSNFTRTLLREELIEIVQPEEYAYSHHEEYMAFFDWALHNADSFSLKSLSLGRTSFYKLHMGKLGYHFGRELVRANLARHVDDEWFLMEQKLGEAFMTFLAILICQETDRDPVTDRFLGVSSLFFMDRHTASRQSAVVKSALRNSILDEILPVPNGLHGIEGLHDVRRFKERYSDAIFAYANAQYKNVTICARMQVCSGDKMIVLTVDWFPVSHKNFFPLLTQCQNWVIIALLTRCQKRRS